MHKNVTRLRIVTGHCLAEAGDLGSEGKLYRRSGPTRKAQEQADPRCAGEGLPSEQSDAPGEEGSVPGRPSLWWAGGHGREGWRRASPQELPDAVPSSPAERLTGLCPCLLDASHSPGQSSRGHSLSSRQGSSPCSSCVMNFGLEKAIPTHRKRKQGDRGLVD